MKHLAARCVATDGGNWWWVKTTVVITAACLNKSKCLSHDTPMPSLSLFLSLFCFYFFFVFFTSTGSRLQLVWHSRRHTAGSLCHLYSWLEVANEKEAHLTMKSMRMREKQGNKLQKTIHSKKQAVGGEGGEDGEDEKEEEEGDWCSGEWSKSTYQAVRTTLSLLSVLW